MPICNPCGPVLPAVNPHGVWGAPGAGCGAGAGCGQWGWANNGGYGGMGGFPIPGGAYL